MRSFILFTIIILDAVAGALAHGFVQNATIPAGGTTYSGYLPYTDPYKSPVPRRIFRKIPGDGPVEDVTSTDLECGGQQNSGSEPAPLAAEAKAGSTIQLHWTAWPESHHGPVITYLARCRGCCTAYQPRKNRVWFKIKEEGKRSDGTWASDDFVTGKPYKFKIPSTLVTGNYIVRHEIIALHSAQQYPGAQFYPSCFQVRVTGGGNSTGPSSKVAFPGAYATNSPGIVYNLYGYTKSSYTIPGPAVWTG